jgi:hypothetical protein
LFRRLARQLRIRFPRINRAAERAKGRMGQAFRRRPPPRG